MTDSRSAIDLVLDFLGRNASGGAPAPAEQWTAAEYRDAWLVGPSGTRRGGHLFLVRNHDVVAFQLTTSTVDDAYDRLPAPR